MSPDMLCYVLALVMFVVGALNISTPALNWLCAGLAFLTLSLII